ncbi:MAG: GTP cyclohydrolase II [Succinivibrio sp.]|nr:GTP cyclohydrolase II [Succinivibrio sp.]MBR1612868.1 GTP cyclohydrolase II [Succinivibrio sp.]
MTTKLIQGPVAALPTRFGNFNITVFKENDFLDHAVIFIGDLKTDEPVLCRIHSECLTGDVFGSMRCDCGFQLSAALEAIQKEGRGALLYMRQEGRGIGLFNKIRAYKLQDNGADTVDANVQLGFPADGREYEACAQIMKNMGFTKVILMTNNPAKIEDITVHGITVTERRPIEFGRNAYNEEYLNTKEKRMRHLLHHQD